MMFDESGCVKIERMDDTFIYFLLDNRQVVYVGQTKSGISRLTGHRDKRYDTVAIMSCEAWELDELEDKFISKYRPKYNKLPNLVMNASLQKVKKLAREATGDKKLTIWSIRKAMKELGVEPFLVESTPYVKRDEASLIIEHFLMQGDGNGA